VVEHEAEDNLEDEREEAVDHQEEMKKLRDQMVPKHPHRQ